ncbi:hypothetical protein [Frigoribacterium salinisoli]
MPEPSPMSGSRRTTLVAGVLVAAGGALSLADALSPLRVLPAAAPVLVLLGVVVLAVGLGREPGLARASVGASTALVAAASPRVVADALLWSGGARLADDVTAVGVALVAIPLVALAAGVVAAAIVVRRRLLGTWARRALVAAVSCGVLVAGLTRVPVLELQLALLDARAPALVPATIVLFGLALLLQGRGRDVRRAIDRWRDSTSVTGPVSGSRPRDRGTAS